MSASQRQVQTRTPVIPVSWWGVAIRAVIGIVVMLGAPIVVGLLLNTFTYPSNQILAGLIAVGLSLLSGSLVFGFVWLWMKYVERRPFGDTSFGPRKIFSGLLAATAATTVLIWVALALTSTLGFTSGDAAQEFPTDFPTAVRVILEIISAAFLLQAIPEELIFRGWLFNLTVRRPWLTFWWTSLTFTALHLLSQGGQENLLDLFLYLISPFGIAVLAAACVLRWGNGWLAAGVHAGAHVGTYLAGFTLSPVVPRADWFAQGLAMSLAGAIILFTTPKVRSTHDNAQEVQTPSPDLLDQRHESPNP